MANLQHGPKARCLTAKETLGTLESWRNNVLYGLRLNPDFRPYLQDNFIFGRKSRVSPQRDFTDTVRTETVAGVEVTTVVKCKEDKTVEVDWLLDQIANFAPNIPRFDITRDSESLAEVWQKIRQFYNKQRAGSLLNDVWNIKRDLDESPQALFGRMKQLYNENLLSTDGLHHVHGRVTEDEELSPTLENTIVLHWLQVLHPDLRDLVTSRFITQLRDHTYGAIFPEISRSIDSLMEEINSGASVCRTFPAYKPQPYQRSKPPYDKPNYDKPAYHFSQSKNKQCEFCKATGRRAYSTHNITDCLYIKKINNNRAANANQIENEQSPQDELQLHYDEFYEDPGEDAAYQVEHVINQVSIDASPVFSLSAYVDNEQIECETTLDTGATCIIVSEKKARSLKAKIRPSCQKVRMADGKSSLEVIGETDITLYRNEKPYHLSAIVCRNTDTEILAGMPFMRQNDIAIRPYTDEIIINGNEYIKYNPSRKSARVARRVVVHSNAYKVILPGQSSEFKVESSGNVAIEPRWDTTFNRKNSKESMLWPTPQVVPVINGVISLTNSLEEPVIIRKSEHFCNILPETTVPCTPPFKLPNKSSLANNLPKSPKNTLHSSAVNLNPDQLLSQAEAESFKEILTTYDQVFDPVIPQYNGNSGPCFVEVNMGPNLPVQRKGRVPFYGRDDLVELQNKFDDLQAKGFLSRPQEIGVTVENINPSFLVKKQPPSTDKRLVTDFGSIANYCRPTPSLLPDVESTLRNIASWKYLLKTDMSCAYHQIKMKKCSKKYCGVHTPFKGLLVYNVGVMGLPGVEVALEELTCLLLGDMVKDGRVAKLADDLFIGGNTINELKVNFQLVLQKLLENDIRLSPSKTVIVPKSVTILGWVWSAGQLRASSHRLNALATCQQPESISALRSYLGAYRFLSRTIHAYASLLSPLEDAIKGKNSKDKVVWSEALNVAFKKSQEALLKSKSVTMPRASDKLCIVTDASIRPGAIGAVLYAVRDGKPLLAGFYNSKLPPFQARWLPCEVEGLAIAAALNHYAPLIIQSDKKPQVITDSKPCIEAIQKLVRGEFSASARLSSFLSSVSRYQPEVLHISGSSNLPADYISRHPLECNSTACSICKFVSETMDSVVLSITVDEILEGKTPLPFINRNSWKAVQEQCMDLRKVQSFRSKGTTPSKKIKNLRSVRRYLSSGTILAHDGVLINPISSPLGSVIERIVVPYQVLHGILTVLHLRLSHPTSHQLSKAFARYFFALNLDKAIREVTKSCHTCAAIEAVPKAMIEESTEQPPTAVGGRFAADIIKRSSQKIFVIRETVTSYTLAEFIPDETVPSVTQSLVKQCNLLRPSPTARITVRVDPAPAHTSMFKNLTKNSTLSASNINLELGRALNKNKNPVIDKGIKELQREFLILDPLGGPMSQSQLSQAVANLNSRYRRSGMSAHELWTQRDQLTGDQLPIKDRELIISQHKARLQNHKFSQLSKSRGKPSRPSPEVKVGSLVYVYTDGTKNTARPRYLVTDISEEWLTLRRFTTHLFGTREYKIKKSECYKVPIIDDLNLPAQRSDSSSSDDEFPSTDFHQLLPQVSAPSEENSQSDSDESYTSDEPEDDDIRDPTLMPPPNLQPASMIRDKRSRRPPDKYGAWTS